jgi:hypothetical protein
MPLAVLLKYLNRITTIIAVSKFNPYVANVIRWMPTRIIWSTGPVFYDKYAFPLCYWKFYEVNLSGLWS